MGCGCISACGCTVVGDGVTASVVRAGDVFTVSAIPFISDLADTNCISLANNEGALTATPILDTGDASVELSCTPAGLHAEVIVDPASTAIVSVSGDGLRVDVPPAADGDGTGEPGDLIFHGGVGLRPGAIDADGDEVDRDDYPALWDALSLYDTDAVRSSGDANITGMTTTRFIDVGMPLEATGFPFGTTVAAINSSTSIEASAPATTSGSDTEVRVYPHGNGDGLDTFNTPDMNRRFPLGYDYVGGAVPIGTLDGVEDVTLLAAQIPAHSHTGSIIGTAAVATALSGAGSITPSTTTDGGHAHAPQAGRSFVTAETATITNVAVNTDGVGTEYSIVVGTAASPPPALGQLNNANTANVSGHDHTTTITAAALAGILALDNGSVDLSGVGVTIDDNVGDASHTNMPPHLVGRWMVHT